MTHSLINTWAVGDPLTSAQLNQMAADDVTSVDKTGDTVTGAIHYSSTSSLIVDAGATCTFNAGITLAGASSTCSGALTFTTGGLLDVSTGAVCNFDTGASCVFDSGATVTFAAGSTSTVSGTVNVATGGLLHVNSGGAFTTAVGSTCTFGASATFSAGLAISGGSTCSSTLVFTAGLLDISTGAIQNFDNGASCVFDAGSSLTLGGATGLTGTMTVSGAGQIARKVRVVTGSAYTIDTSGALTDEVVAVSNSSGGSYNVTLPLASSLVGRELVICDALLNAGTHNIVVSCAGADNFGISTGTTVATMSSNGTTLRLISGGAAVWLKAG